MKVHTVKPHPSRPRHTAGEVVIATFGNYIENPSVTGKDRPAVILRAGDRQHWVAGLTRQPRFKTTGEARAMVPISRTCPTCGTSFLWSYRPSYVGRMYVRSHVGWVGHDVLDVFERHMRLPWYVLAELRAVADAMTNTDGMVPAETL